MKPFVVSVGNIAFGGRAKTPTVAQIARLLLEMGERPAILSRGYGRRLPDGTYQASIDIAPRYRDYFKIAGAGTNLTITIESVYEDSLSAALSASVNSTSFSNVNSTRLAKTALPSKSSAGSSDRATK